MIIGITGSIGGGKGTVVDYLRKKKNFAHYSSSDFLVEILKERGEMVDRDGMGRIANELRAQNPAGVPAETYKQYEKDNRPENAIFEALHSVSEVEFVKSIGGKVIAVTAGPDVRYERIVARGSVKDHITKAKFIEQQQREEIGSNDPNKNNIFDAINASDFILQNSGTIEELHTQIDALLKQIEHKN